MVQTATFLSFVALAVAAPTAILRRGEWESIPGKKPATTQYESTFDDLEPVAGGLISIQAVGPYNGLDYEGISKHNLYELNVHQLTPTDLITLGIQGEVIAGVNPESSPNAGAYSARSQLLDSATPVITTQYSGSVTDTFDFQKFYFGCVAATAETIASVPLACTVKVQGFKASKEVAEQEFKFNPGLLQLTVDMVEAKLNDKFKGVDTVTFTTDYALPAVGATLLDSLSYKTYNAVDAKDGEDKKEAH